MKSRTFARAAFAALALVVVFSALAFGAGAFSPRVNVSLSGTVARGGGEVLLEQAGKVSPGEIISWNVAASNIGDAPAHSINVVGDIPQGTAYVDGSAGGDGVVGVKFSLEHPHENQTFTERPTVHYTEGGVDRERPARADEYKAIQMTFARIGAGESLKASYRTSVR